MRTLHNSSTGWMRSASQLLVRRGGDAWHALISSSSSSSMERCNGVIVVVGGGVRLRSSARWRILTIYRTMFTFLPLLFALTLWVAFSKEENFSIFIKFDDERRRVAENKAKIFSAKVSIFHSFGVHTRARARMHWHRWTCTNVALIRDAFYISGIARFVANAIVKWANSPSLVNWNCLISSVPPVQTARNSGRESESSATPSPVRFRLQHT